VVAIPVAISLVRPLEDGLRTWPGNVYALPTRRGPGLKHRIALAFILSGVWLAWSGHTEPLLLALGAGALGFVVWLSVHMKVIDSESVPIGLRYGRLLLYVPWLAVEVFKSNVAVARRIVTPGPLRIDPRMLRVPASQRTELAQVLFANSITLTPGTISVDVRGGEVLVHALYADAAAGVEAGLMNQKCAELETQT
jgi:multicomponent Na+:H+ antiporter subunit E